MIFLISLNIYILLSIKTRIETDSQGFIHDVTDGFISYYPLKQGLKRELELMAEMLWGFIYILLSIKTRIETTGSNPADQHRLRYLHPTIH